MSTCPQCSERMKSADECGECGWKPGLIRDNATVTVKDTVDGTKKRRQGGYTRRAITTTMSIDDVDPGVRAAAMAVKKPGQLLRVVSKTEVWVVNPS